jgi:hypothetical protein
VVAVEAARTLFVVVVVGAWLRIAEAGNRPSGVGRRAVGGRCVMKQNWHGRACRSRFITTLPFWSGMWSEHARAVHALAHRRRRFGARSFRVAGLLDGAAAGMLSLPSPSPSSSDCHMVSRAMNSSSLARTSSSALLSPLPS